MHLSELLPRLNLQTCPFCQSLMQDFTKPEPNQSCTTRCCIKCSPPHSYLILSFAQDLTPYFLIAFYQDFTATLFFPRPAQPLCYTKLSHQRKVFATLNEWPELNLTQPQEFLSIMQLHALLS